MLIQKRHLPIFMKIVLMFLAAVIPIYVCGILINMSSQKEVREEIFKSTKPKIDFYVNMLENEIKNTIQMRLNFFADKDLQSLSIEAMTLKNYDKYITMQHMQTKLARFKDVSNYITSVNIYIPLINKTISNSSVQDMSDSKFDGLKQTIRSGQYPFAEKDGRLFMYSMPFFSEFDINGKEYPPYIISIEISRDELKDTLKQFSGYGSGNAFLISSTNGLNITRNAGSPVEETISGYLNENVIPDTDTHIMSLMACKENYIVIYKKSTALKTVFVSYVPEKKLLLPLNRYRIWLWAVSFITILLVLLFSVWIYRMVVKPLNTLMDAFTKIEEGDFNISLSNKEENEFGYLYKRVNLVCGRLSMLIEQVYEQKAIVQNSKLKQLQYQANPIFYGMMESMQSACQQIYNIWSSSATSGREVEWDKLNSKFISLEQMISQASGLNEEFMIDGQDGAVNNLNFELNKEQKDDKQIRELLKKIQLMEILLESGQQNEFVELYSKYIDSVKLQLHASIHLRQEAYFALAMMFLSCLNKIGLTDRINEKVPLAKLMKWDEHSTWEEVDSYFQRLSIAIFEQIKADKNHYSNRILSFVEGYIKQHYKDDISLTTISELLHFNSSYFSRLFKSISGKGLGEYIAEMKIVKAKEMLVNDNIRINEIAESLGFSAAPSFTRFFRKYTNQSPQEYKDNAKK